MARLYALTRKDVEWIGMAASVGGGFVLRSDEGDIYSITKAVTGREYLGTMAGLSERREVTQYELEEIIRRYEAIPLTSQHYIIREADEERSRLIRRLREWAALPADLTDGRDGRELALIRSGLTPQEAAVQVGMESGERTSDIAERLGIAPSGVSNAKSKARAKLVALRDSMTAGA